MSKTSLEGLPKPKISNSTTITEIVKSEFPQISKNKDIKGKIIFEIAIKDVIEFLGIEFTPKQMIDLGAIMYSNYYYWSMPELELFCFKFKNNEFKDLYGWSKVNPSHILEASDRYNSELLIERSNHYSQKKIETLRHSIFVGFRNECIRVNNFQFNFL